MRARGRCCAWSACITIASIIVVRARYITDLSAFFPDSPTPKQQLLVDQLRDGPASRLILIAIEGARRRHARGFRAAMAARLAPRPRNSPASTNGEPVSEQTRSRFSVSASLSAERSG